MVPQLCNAEWLPIVVVYYVKPQSFDRDALVVAAVVEILRRYGSVEVDLPQIDLEPEVDAHQPALVPVLELLELNHTDCLSDGWLVPSSVLCLVMLEGFCGVVEPSTEREPRVLHRRLPLDRCFLVLGRSQAVLLREEGLVRTVQVSLKDPEVSQVADYEEVLCIDLEHV